jgi:hypothetical protein
MIDVKFAQISLRFEIYFVGATKLIVELAYFYWINIIKFLCDLK